MLISSSSHSSIDHVILNIADTKDPLVGVCIATSHSCITGAVIQSTVASADPVSPSVFSKRNSNDPFWVNSFVLFPLLLVMVTPVVENHVSVAVTGPVVLVEGVYVIVPVIVEAVVPCGFCCDGTHSPS
jgi:hypothetical protein